MHTIIGSLFYMLLLNRTNELYSPCSQYVQNKRSVKMFNTTHNRRLLHYSFNTKPSFR